MDSEHTQEITKRYKKFRVLIIGRANAGKTTILKRVCDTTENPKIYNKHGRKMNRSILDGSAERGDHDIDNEMVFESNPRFRFHDSRGFEAGDVLELDKVNAFIAERSQERTLRGRLHAIWYCIPVDDSRPFTAAEERFFSTCGTGNVPVIAVFTKFDALDNKSFAALRKEKLSRADAKREAPKRAAADFEKSHLPSVYAKPYPPRNHVCLRDMDKDGANCNELIRQTVAALDEEALQQLLVSTQHNNLRLCTEYALKRVTLPRIVEEIRKTPAILGFRRGMTKEDLSTITASIFLWFPHLVSP